MSNSLWPHGLQHARPPCPSPTPGVYSSLCPLSWWCHPSISFSVIPFSSHLQPLPASGSFPMSQIFASGGQSIRVSASSLVLPMSIQDWFPLGSPCCPRDSQESFPTPQNFEHHSSKASIKDTRINSCYIVLSGRSGLSTPSSFYPPLKNLPKIVVGGWIILRETDISF